jgi:Uma2 family endonuclease
LNPTAIVEVLSDGTERYDRGEKFEHYKKIASLQAYILISQKTAFVEMWCRDADSWIKQEARTGERLSVQPIHCDLDIAELYRGILDS